MQTENKGLLQRRQLKFCARSVMRDSTILERISDYALSPQRRFVSMSRAYKHEDKWEGWYVPGNRCSGNKQVAAEDARQISCEQGSGEVK